MLITISNRNVIYNFLVPPITTLGSNLHPTIDVLAGTIPATTTYSSNISTPTVTHTAQHPTQEPTVSDAKKLGKLLIHYQARF